MKIHLVAIDLDGTLLNSANEISEASATILRTIRAEHNVHVVLASARPPRSVLPFYHLLELDAPMINYNGALVFDPPSRRVLLHTPVSGKIARGVAELARREYPDVLVSAEILDRWYTDRVDNAYVTETGRLFRPDLVAPMDEWLSGPVTKLLLLGESDELRRIGKLMATEYRYQITVIQTEPELLQITHPTVSKAQALKTVAGEMAVRREQVMAIGDNANDLEMLRWAGIGVAMANAPMEVQAVANYVTDFNDADGVAKAIHELIIKG
jgi:Cof subfamily protein (haloacid dehalogenase superfamily)